MAENKEDAPAPATVKVKFIGDPNDEFSGPTRMVWKGIEFRKGKFVDVPVQHEANLRAHTHFVVKGQDDPSADPEATGKKWTIEELRALLDERGAKYTRRHGAADLMAIAEETGGLPEKEADE